MMLGLALLKGINRKLIVPTQNIWSLKRNVMNFQGAVIKEQGIVFAIVIVKSHILSMNSEINQTARRFQQFFPGLPIILMAQDSRGIPTYYGRKDIVNFLSRISIQSIPWKEYVYA
jgi:hypothetical protein